MNVAAACSSPLSPGLVCAADSCGRIDVMKSPWRMPLSSSPPLLVAATRASTDSRGGGFTGGGKGAGGGGGGGIQAPGPEVSAGGADCDHAAPAAPARASATTTARR